MRRRGDILFFWGVMLAGAALHAVVWHFKTGMHYPDEIFQYVEPAFIRLEGFGWLPWEFDRGVRNWSLIAFYGGWMKLFGLLGAHGADLHRLIGLHNALLALLVVPALMRLGDRLGGRVAAWSGGALAALMPTIAYFSPHPLSEVPSMVLSTWGLVLWVEGRGAGREWKPAALAGMLLGFSVVARFFSAAFLVVPALDYLARALRRRGRPLLFFSLGGLVPLIVLGATDWAAWGAPFHSAIEYFRYNILEWGNADHGVSPWWQYLLWIWQRLHWGLLLLVPLCLLGAARAWPLLASALVSLLFLSLLSHKEERFMLAAWPLLVACAAAGAGQCARWAGERGARVAGAAAAVAVCALLAASALGVRRLEWHWYSNYFEGQRWVGRQADASGCMFHGRLHLSGGSVWLDRNVPMDSYQPRLARNPLFNYFIFPATSPEARLAQTHGWQERARFGDMVVYYRRSD